MFIADLFNWYMHYSDQFLLGELIFLSLLAIVFFLLKIHFKKNEKDFAIVKSLLEKIDSCFLTCIISGIVLIFCEWQRIPYLAAPIFILIYIIIFLYWIIKIFLYYKNNFHITLNQEQEDKIYNKYLP